MSQFSKASLDLFLERVRQAQRSRSKNVTLTIEEAQDLALTMAQVVSRENILLEELNELRKSQGNIEVQFNGGGFK